MATHRIYNNKGESIRMTLLDGPPREITDGRLSKSTLSINVTINGRSFKEYHYTKRGDYTPTCVYLEVDDQWFSIDPFPYFYHLSQEYFTENPKA